MKQFDTILAFLYSSTVVVLSHEVVSSNLRGGFLYTDNYTLIEKNDPSFATVLSDGEPISNSNHGNGNDESVVAGGGGGQGGVVLHEDLCQDVLQTCTTNCVKLSGGSKTQSQCRVSCRAKMIQSCTTNCISRSGGSKTRSQCRTLCNSRYRNGSGSESVGPGKHFTIAPTPTPPSRGRIYCIQNCDAKGGRIEVRTACKAKCPVPEFDWEIC